MSNYTLECTNGTWEGGNFPECERQMKPSQIEDMTVVLSNRIRRGKDCFSGEKEFVTEYDCSKYGLCSEGRLELHECESPLVFNITIGYCQSPSNVDCQQQENDFELYGTYLYSNPNVYYSETQINLLSKVFPIITLHPDRKYEPNSLMTIGAAGELVIYPKSNVTLNCLFPIPYLSTGAESTWIVNYFEPSHYEKRHETSRFFSKSLKLELLTESDSGIYTCVGPNGRRNDVEIIVRDITCPSLNQLVPGIVIQADYKPYENATFRPITVGIRYRCPSAHGYSKPKRVFCTRFGYWSKYYSGRPANQFDICKES